MRLDEGDVVRVWGVFFDDDRKSGAHHSGVAVPGARQAVLVPGSTSSPVGRERFVEQRANPCLRRGGFWYPDECILASEFRGPRPEHRCRRVVPELELAAIQTMLRSIRWW